MPDDSEATLARKAVPKGIVIYRVFGALFFGAADKLETSLQQSHTEPDVLILKMHEVISSQRPTQTRTSTWQAA